MRIAHVVWALGTGGIETMLVDIMNEQVKTEDVCLFVINSVYNSGVLAAVDKRISVVFCGRKPQSKSFLPIIKLNYALWRFHPDIVHCHHDKVGNLIYYPAVKVRTVHNTHSNSKDYKQFNRLFCISQSVKKHIAEQGFPNGIVVYNGIHTKDICQRSYGDNMNSKEKRFVCVGRLHPDKGLMLIVEAFDILINKKGLNNFSIDLIGDGLQRAELEAKIQTKHLENHIRLLGSKPRSTIYPTLCEYDLFILPSVSEGFGLSVAEACAAKIPVLVCDLEGPLEVIDDGSLGRTFKTGDAEDLANHIMDYLENGSNSKQVEDAFRFVSEHFDVTRTAQQYIENYKIIKSNK